jgi:peptide deformylase
MAKLVEEQHPALHNIAEEVPVEEITASTIQKVITDMKTALVSYDVDGFNGVAIAAPQIGIPLRIFLVHDTSTETPDVARIPDLVAILQ